MLLTRLGLEGPPYSRSAKRILLVEAQRAINDGARWLDVARCLGVSRRTLERWRRRHQETFPCLLRFTDWELEAIGLENSCWFTYLLLEGDAVVGVCSSEAGMQGWTESKRNRRAVIVPDFNVEVKGSMFLRRVALTEETARHLERFPREASGVLEAWCELSANNE